MSFVAHILVCENELCRAAHYIDERGYITRIARQYELTLAEREIVTALPIKFCLAGNSVEIVRCTNDACLVVYIQGLPPDDEVIELPYCIGNTIDGKTVTRLLCTPCKQRLQRRDGKKTKAG